MRQFAEAIWLTLAMGMLICGMAGCRARGNSLELLEQENLRLEDRIYELEYDLEQAQAELEAIREQNDDNSNTSRPPLFRNLDPGKPLRERDLDQDGMDPPTTRDDGLDLEPPGVDLGPPAASQDDASGPLMPEEIGTGQLSRKTDSGRGVRFARNRSQESGSEVGRISINRLLTGGYDADGKPGDDGLLLVIEQYNPRGELVHVRGELHIALRDPSKFGKSAELARWQFAPHELPRHFQRDALGDTLHFKLPWPGPAPTKQRLSLEARFTTLTGEEFEAQGIVMLDPTIRWAPRAADNLVRTPRRQPASRRHPPRATLEQRIEEATRLPTWSPYR